MATAAEVQDVLGRGGACASIILEETRTSSGGTILTKNYFCLGGTDAPGKTAWATVTVANSAATQAAAVLVALRA